MIVAVYFVHSEGYASPTSRSGLTLSNKVVKSPTLVGVIPTFELVPAVLNLNSSLSV